MRIPKPASPHDHTESGDHSGFTFDKSDTSDFMAHATQVMSRGDVVTCDFCERELQGGEHAFICSSSEHVWYRLCGDCAYRALTERQVTPVVKIGII